MATGKNIRTFEGHSEPVNSAMFSSDGKYIVSASQDKTVKIWDIATGKELQTLEGHTSYVNFASFSPDSKYIVTASDDKTIKIWDFPSFQDLIDDNYELFKEYPLTPEERRKYYLE